MIFFHPSCQLGALDIEQIALKFALINCIFYMSANFFVLIMSHNPTIKNPREISSRFVKIDGLEAILTAIPTTLLLKNRPFFTEYNTQIHEYLPHFTV